MTDVLLDALDNASTDKELFDAASAIVCIPKVESSSFILHAPLEICARYFLLPLVDDDFVAGARKQIRMTAKKYYEYENADATQIHEFDINTVNYGEWATSLLFASHGPVLLALQSVIGETNESIFAVLGRMGREIFDAPEAQMAWSHKPQPSEDISADLLQHPQDWFIEHVGNIEHVDGGPDLIRASVEHVEASGQITPLINVLGGIANFSDRAHFEIPFQSLIRVCALSMIKETETHAKYGWTHCLTLPHALWVLSAQSENSARMLQAATILAATFRATQGECKLDGHDLTEYCELDESSIFAEHYVRMADIISQSCVMEDAHLVKYVYACFDCMKRDPQYSKLYIAAAGRLLGIWQNESE